MTRKKQIPPVFNRTSNGSLVSAVGSGIGLAFVDDYFPEAHHTIRIASGYFRLQGYELARKNINPDVQLRILVRANRGEGRNVQLTAIEVIEEIVEDLGQCKIPLAEAVKTIVKQINDGKFFIRDAYDTEPFHCKYYIFDESLLWQGSANFTNNGLCVNAEQASLIRQQNEVQGFIYWFDTVSENARDLLGLLKNRLEEWLELATPFDIYLKTLFLLFKDLADEPLLEGANLPAYFQKGVIEKSLHQIEKYGGSLIVAATGLGKTIIGSEIASRLSSNNKIRQIIFLAPYNVFDNWKSELKGRRVRNFEFFNIRIPFLEKSYISHHKISRLESELKYPPEEMLIIIDEAHNYRNQLFIQNTNEKRVKRTSRVYKLLTPVIEKGAKIVLLTATAYSTSPMNINSLLYLLPHKSKDLLGPNAPWKIESTDQFSSLPVVTTLGLPHVLKMARDREDIDENGRVYIELAGINRYLPENVVLHRINYRLPLQKELQKAFDENCFDHSQKLSHTFYDADSIIPRRGISDFVFNPSMMGWLSSPASVKLSLEQNLATPGKETAAKNKLQQNLFGNSDKTEARQRKMNDNARPFKGEMFLSQAKRQSVLAPIYKKLKRQKSVDDEKFLELKSLIEKRIVIEKGKVIVFINRFSTAVYLNEELSRVFDENLKIGCTVKKGKNRLQLKSNKTRAEILKNFSPKSHHHLIKREEYDLLICTDADGVGVNLQDADTLVNYDLPLGADVLFQRVGRILRMTDDAQRKVHIYTFLPSIINEHLNGSNIHQKIHDLAERLRQRQNKSNSISILGTKILSSEEREETTLSSESEIEDLLRESETVNEINAENSPIRHISLLEMKGIRERAAQIPDFIFSARVYDESVPRLFILFKHREDYFPVIYNIADKGIARYGKFEILDLLECSENEETAPVDVGKIEEASNNAAEELCDILDIPLKEITKICGLYFVPSDESKPKDIFGDLRTKKTQQIILKKSFK